MEIGPEVIDSKHFCIFVEAAKEVELNFRMASTEGCNDLRCHMDFPVCCELSFYAVSPTVTASMDSSKNTRLILLWALDLALI